jgi:hypothetical protein
MSKSLFVTIGMAVALSAAPLSAEAPALPAVDARPALPFPPGIVPQEICGTTTDFQDVENYDGTLGVTKPYVVTHEPSTVQLQWLGSQAIAEKLPNHSPGNVPGERWCSGTLIAGNRVLTAGHCFDVQDGKWGWISPFTLDPNSGDKVFAPPKVLATLQVVNFRYQINGSTGAVRTPSVYPILDLIEYRNGSLDYAIVQLGANAAGDLPSVSFTAANVLTRGPVVQELIGLLQHPQGDPKKVEAGHVLKVDGTKVYYDDVDSLGGSSGSGVRDGSGSVIGVHTNGGCTANGGANRGVTTQAIAGESQVF